MLRGTTDIVDDLGDRLHKVGRSHMTVRWPDFYELCSRERFKQRFLDKVTKEAKSRHQLIVAYGDNVVVICYDKNFADFKKPTRVALPEEF